MHPIEHNLRGAIPASGHIAGHLIVPLTGQPEIDYAQLHIRVHRNVRRLKVTMDYTRSVHVLQQKEMKIEDLNE